MVVPASLQSLRSMQLIIRFLNYENVKHHVAGDRWSESVNRNMSDYHGWQKYCTASDEYHLIEAYLHRKVWCPEARVSLRSLLNCAHLQGAPTREWYALHHIAKGHDKWSFDVMAWGLNIARSDLSIIERKVAYIFAAQIAMELRESQVPVPDVAKIEPHGIAYIFDEAIDEFEALYSKMSPRSAGVRVPRYWRERAQHAFVLNCTAAARQKTKSSHQSKPATNCLPLRLRPSGINTKPRVSLDFDCVDRVFSMSGLKLGTMRALARVWGFNNAEIENLIKRRCSPIPIFAQLVANPEQFRGMMHDCDVVLTGSRAVGFFCPSAGTANADWRFVTHPHVSHWLKFAAYLVSIGVKFDFSTGIEDIKSTSDGSGSEREHHSAVKTLSGTLIRKGRHHRIQLAAHLEHPRQQSSIQQTLQLHSSIDQCLITGFGAVCMYAQQTTVGQSHIWRVGHSDDSALRVKDQKQIDSYIKMGIDYTQPRSHVALNPHQVPEPKLRKLGDAGSLCISFERYVNSDKVDLVRTDFDLLQDTAWWEECHALKPVRQAGGSFWNLELDDSWAERAILKAGRVLRVPLFDSMMERLQCTQCQINNETLCTTHAFDKSEKQSEKLLFFCLRHVERRRMSWNFLGLDFRWDECWEYPYV